MSGKFYNLDTDGTLGGQNPADIIVSSQKAVRTYVDGEIDSVNDKIDAIEIVDELAELQDTDIKSVANGQALVYNETTGKWENKAITTDAAAWGNISGNISDQTDLTTALNNKANKSHTHTSSQITDLTIPTKVSDLQNDSGFIDETALDGYVQDTRKINNKPLSADITLSSSDIGAQTEITSSNKLSSDLVDDTNKTHKFVTNAQMSTWNNKQDAINDLADIRTGAGKGATAIQPGDNISELVNDAGYLTESDISAVMTYKGTVSTQEDLPTSGNKKGDVYTVVDDGAEYVWNSTSWEYLGQLLDLDGYVTEDQLAGYVPTSRKVNNKTLTSNITLSASDVNAHPTITSSAKLSSDLVDDTNQTNKFVTATEKTTWNNKQNKINDIETIRANASSGAQAAATIAEYGDIVSHDASEFQEAGDYAAEVHTHAISDVTNLQTTLDGKQASITSTNKLSADLLSEGTNNKLVSQTEKNTWSGKQDALSATQLANITAGGTALQPGDDISELTNDAGYITGVTWNDVENKPSTFTPSTHNHTSSQITDLDTTISTAIAGKANTEDLADVATSGSYNDLSDKPTIPTVGNAEIEIQKNGTKVDSFTTNQSGSKKTINITVPTNNNQLTNGAGYITSSALPTSLSELTDDLGSNPTHTHSQYLTSHQDISGKANASEVYTKTEIDGKLASGMHYKGTKASASALPTTGNQIGDLYNVTDTGANYAWDGTQWDKLSENVDLSGLVPNTRTVNGKALSSDITLTYSDVSAASSSHTHSNYVPTTRRVAGKALSADITLSASDVGALPSDTSIPTKTSELTNDSGFLTEHQDISGKQDASTAVTHTANTSVGNTTTPVYVASNGKATALGYTIAKSVPSDAKFTDTTYTAGSGLSLSGTQFKHTNSVTSGTAGTSSATSGKTLSVPYVTYDAQGHITATGVHTHTVSGFLTEHQSLADYAKTADLATVATSGDYDDLDNKPTIPTTYSDIGAASASHTHTYSDVGAASAAHTHNYVPTTRKVNNKALSADITLSASDVSAAAADHTHTYSDVGAASSAHTHSNYVPTTRTVNSKALSANITLSASDVGALSDDTVIPSKTSELTNDSGFITGVAWGDVTGKPSTFTPAAHNQATNTINALTGYTIATQAAALSTSDTLNVALGKLQKSIDGKQASGNYVPTSRTVNSKALSADITLSASDVGAATSDHTHTYSDVGAASSAHTHSAYNFTAGTGLSLSGTVFNHTNSVTSGTVGTSAATSGSTLAVPYVTYDAQGHIKATGTHTHTISGFVPTTRTVNSKALSSNITLSASDVGALADTTVIPTVTDTYSSTSTNAMSGKAVASAISNKADKATSLSGYGITDAYTKTEIDGKLTSGMHYKGTKTTASALPTTGNETGDMWNVTDTGANYAWNGTEWDKLSETIDLSGYVPTSRTINSKALTGNISLTYSDVGAASTSHTHSYVPTSRTVNGKALSANITLSASDVSALPSDTVIPTVPTNVSEFTNDAGYITSYTDTKNTAGTTNKAATKLFLAGATSQAANPQTYSNVNVYIGTDNCLYSNGTKVLTAHQDLSGYVPTSRTINSKALTDNITLSASDVGALPSTTSIPTKVSELTNDSGYTTNTGTITGITMNGASKGTSGVVDLGTVLTAHQTIKQDSITGATANRYVACSTAAATAAKTGNITSGTFNLETGSSVKVKFANANTADNPTLNINSKGAKNIFHKGAQITTGSNKALLAGICEFVYDGTQWHLVGNYIDDNTTYTAGTGLSLSGTQFKHSNSVTAGTVGTSTASSGSTLSVPYVTYDAQGHVTATGTRTHTVSGFLTSSSTLDATKLSGTIPTSCYTNTTYTAGTGLSLSGTTINHAATITAGTVGTSAATSGSTLAVPYVTYNASGHVTAVGTHTHTISGFAATTHNQASNTINAMTGYAIATASASITTSDSLNTAIAKLEYKANQAVSGTVTVGQLAG